MCGLLLLCAGCLRMENPLVVRQPLTATLDSGAALLTDGGIAAIAFRDVTGTLTDICRPLAPTCDLERDAAPETRTAAHLQTPYGEGVVMLLTMPPGRYRMASVLVREGSGTRRIMLDAEQAPVIEVHPHEAVLAGELLCPGYRWRSCLPVWRSSLVSKRKILDILRWELSARAGSDSDLTVRQSWLPRLDASYARLVHER
jgi:hypothetical protein